MCYDQYNISFEWCHAISDGRGGFSFFSSVLCHYFGVDRMVEPALELGLESFYDKAEKGIPQKKTGAGICSQCPSFYQTWLSNRLPYSESADERGACRRKEKGCLSGGGAAAFGFHGSAQTHEPKGKE